MLDQALDALKTYDWGVDPSVLAPIDDAVTTTYGDAGARKDLEAKLAAFLTESVSRDAKDYVCRKLMLIGTAPSVAGSGRFAPRPGFVAHGPLCAWSGCRLPKRRRPCATRWARFPSEQKVGVIGSLGVRRDTASVSALAALLGESNAAVARAAAFALGDIGDADACQGFGRGQVE